MVKTLFEKLQKVMPIKRKEIGSDKPLYHNSLHRMIVQIMQDEKRPMRVKEITKKVLEKRRIAIKLLKTPSLQYFNPPCTPKGLIVESIN